jgi:hypothetical protein
MFARPRPSASIDVAQARRPAPRSLLTSIHNLRYNLLYTLDRGQLRLLCRYARHHRYPLELLVHNHSLHMDGTTPQRARTTQGAESRLAREH